MKTGDWTGVAALAGRRVDAKHAAGARFPDAAVAVVSNDIRRLLEVNEVGTLVASAACGADIVALEAALGLGLRVVIVLPFEPARFRSTSVTDRGEEWGKRFDALLKLPPARCELIVLKPAAGSDDAAYAEATRRIVAEAERRAPTDESALAIAVWEGQARLGTDATQDFIDRATAAGMRVRVVISRPDEAARRYLAGAREAPEHALDLREALVQSDPVLAYQLTTEVARRFLHEHVELSPDTLERCWRACKKVEAFGFARRILRRRIEALKASTNGKPSPELTELCQQQALCTSKDPDLAAAVRHDWALRILKPEDHPRNSEHQGIAGGIWKRKWEWDGSRANLERSLEHYRAGIPDQPPGQQKRGFSQSGYVEINCAFVLELLASLARDSDTSQRYRSEARALREELMALQPTDKWNSATLAEACVGLERFPEACAAMTAYLGFEPDPWELDTTLRQLVRLAHVCGKEL